MANKPQALKYIRKTAPRTAANRHIRSELRTLAKKVQAASGGEDKDAAKETARLYVSALDRAVKRNVVHKNKANRHKSEVAPLFA